MEEYYTTEEEIAGIIYDTDIYEKIRSIVQVGTHDTNYLVSVITNNINVHYSYHLKNFENPSPKRKAYLIDHIEGELSWYLHESNLVT